MYWNVKLLLVTLTFPHHPKSKYSCCLMFLISPISHVTQHNGFRPAYHWPTVLFFTGPPPDLSAVPGHLEFCVVCVRSYFSIGVVDTFCAMLFFWGKAGLRNFWYCCLTQAENSVSVYHFVGRGLEHLVSEYHCVRTDQCSDWLIRYEKICYNNQIPINMFREGLS